ncbi:MAG: cold-shock protein [Pseudomonadales bacterium]
MSERQSGTVKWFNDAKGYGFIERNEGDDVFVHYRSIRGEGFRTLKQGSQVEFELAETEKGFQAEDVVEV